MKKAYLRINIFCYLIIAAFLVVMVTTSLRSGYPWALTCYNCVLCRQACPLGIDPYGFVTAALTSDPDLYVAATNVRLKLKEAFDLDPGMVLRTKNGTTITAARALDEGMGEDREVTVEKMKVKHAARYCVLCGNCEKVCPLNLKVMDIIMELRDDGKFNRE
ncbi:MAG: 4Fe-4S dicluster domain-containing protein [Deltaproteobacteria bacterium]|nr:4Fe-4S dicluster domain-containing protein [Deltaproteobacteria bacterium]